MGIRLPLNMHFGHSLTMGRAWAQRQARASVGVRRHCMEVESDGRGTWLRIGWPVTLECAAIAV
jgi:hypothetical protein